MKLSKLATTLLRNTAPTLLAALALPPPFNVIASGVASAALNAYFPEEKPSGPDATGRSTPDPAQIEKVIEKNAEDPDFALALRQAEVELQRYEIESGLRFQEIELEDRKRASEMQVQSGIAPVVFHQGMRLVWIAMAGLLFLTVGLLGVTFVPDTVLAKANSELLIAVFGLIGTVVGFVSGIASNIVSFYWGSSQGSKDKTDALNSNFREIGGQLAKVTAEVEVRRQQQVLTPSEEQQQGQSERRPQKQLKASYGGDAAKAAGFSIADILPALTAPHKKFADSVSWALVDDGISIEGAPAEKTNGEPKTIRSIWDHYGKHCQDWARSYGVPVELIVATIATETGGDRNARRFERKPNEESVGVMQTLVSTARWALGRDSIKGDDLVDPNLSIEAGTAYISSQRNETSFDPPLVAAAYNAGSIRKEAANANKWRLVCYPANTGRHITRFTEWFGDAMRLSAEQNWSDSGNVPSFAAALGAGSVGSAGSAGSADRPDTQETLSSPLLKAWSGSISLSELRNRAALTKEVQQALIFQGYLDPPADSQFGSVSDWAIKQHCLVCQIPIATEFSEAIANSLLAPLEQLPDWIESGQWFDKVVHYMQDHGYWYCRVPETKNILYLEGVDRDGKLNLDTPDMFNDLRCVFWLDKDGKPQHKTWEATTEPGRKYTMNPITSKGAARIKFGQYKAWRVGLHRNDHEALRQVNPLPVHRDLNKDFKRTGDKVDIGQHYINQHWGYDHDKDSIGGASAGCLVGRTQEGHRDFMALIKTDPRYVARNTYTFMTTILPADEVLR